MDYNYLGIQTAVFYNLNSAASLPSHNNTIEKFKTLEISEQKI